MWKRYKKTFVGMQITILAIASSALLVTRSWAVAVGLVVTSEIFSAYGALWGARLERFVRARQ